MKIPFNIPYIQGNENIKMQQVLESRKLSGNATYTKKCQSFFEKKYGFKKSFLTNSCTDALEMTSILMDIKIGDEIIIPSYTFVSTANAFALRGAKIIFADSQIDHPNIDENKIEKLISHKTKAIVVVHYAGFACNMDVIMNLANKYNLFVVEDAAQAIDGFYKGKAIGSIGHFGTFSFHETKNIISGEGGMLVVNDIQFIKRAEIIWEKGTNRSSFLRGDVSKYNWIDLGSSFLPSEITAAFLLGQLENILDIQSRRVQIWDRYYQNLTVLNDIDINILPKLPNGSTKNGHLFYLICKSEKERDELIKYLKLNAVQSVFHYQALHKSPYFKEKFNSEELINSIKFSERLLRLPLYYDLTLDDVDRISNLIHLFFTKSRL